MSVRMCVMASAVFGLTGCDRVSGVADVVVDRVSSLGAAPDVTSEGIRTMSLLGGDVRVRGPEGYCIDQGASNARRGFAVLVGCALLSDDAAVMPSLDGLITVQFGDEGTASVVGNEETFAGFLRSDAGRAVLSRDGGATSIEDVSTITDAGVVLARFDDTSGPAFSGTSGAQWRGFADVNGRLATVSVLSFDRAALSRGEGERLLVVALTELAGVNAPDDGTEENG